MNREEVLALMARRSEVAFRDASPESLARLDALGFPKNVRDFYAHHEPSACAEIDSVRLWPIDDIAQRGGSPPWGRSSSCCRSDQRRSAGEDFIYPPQADLVQPGAAPGGAAGEHQSVRRQPIATRCELPGDEQVDAKRHSNSGHHCVLHCDWLGTVRAERRSYLSGDSSFTRLEPAVRGSPGRIGACFQPAMDWHRALGEIPRQSRNVVSPWNRRRSTLFNCGWHAVGKWNASFHSAVAGAERTFTFRISCGGNNCRGLSVLASPNTR